MIKVKAGELFLSQAALSELATKDLPNRTALLLRRIIKKVDPEIKLFDDQRLKVAQEYGTSTDGGKSFSISDDKLGEFNAQMSILGETEFEFSDMETLKPEALGDVQVKAATLMALSWLIPD